MPVYQFRCLECKKKFEKNISYQKYGKTVVSCPFCQSKNIQRAIKATPVNLAQDSIKPYLEDPSSFSRMEDDPQAMGKAMREMSRQTGEKLEPEFNEVVERLEKGQSFQQIEKELPDIDPPADSSTKSD